MQFLSISQRRNGFAENDYASLAEQEMERARELYSQGLIRQIWHRLDRPGACCATRSITARSWAGLR